MSTGTPVEYFFGNVLDGLEPTETYVCTRYDYACSANDTSCTSAEQASGVPKTAYTFNTQKMCNYMKSVKQVYKNVACCTSDNCNKP